jgi:hypothetical protein
MEAKKLKALHLWLEANPHLEDSGDLTSRASLLQICLGLGILLDDACRVLFTGVDEYPEGTPSYIINSIWGTTEYDKLVDYTRKLQGDLLNDANKSRYLIFKLTQCMAGTIS